MESELFSPSSGGWSWEGPGRSQGREVTSEAQKGRKVGFVPHAVKQRAEFVHLNCLSMKAWETASAAELLTSAAPVSTCARRSAPRLLLNPPLLHAGLSRFCAGCCRRAITALWAGGYWAVLGTSLWWRDYVTRIWWNFQQVKKKCPVLLLLIGGAAPPLSFWWDGVTRWPAVYLLPLLHWLFKLLTPAISQTPILYPCAKIICSCFPFR